MCKHSKLGEIRRKGAKSETCVEKKIGEMRRKGANSEKCVEKVQIQRNSSERSNLTFQIGAVEI